MESIKPRLRTELYMCTELIITSYWPNITIDHTKSVYKNIDFSREKRKIDRLEDIRDHNAVNLMSLRIYLRNRN
jgi:hypothetical protein